MADKHQTDKTSAKDTGEAAASTTTKESLENGQKAVEIQKKLDGKPASVSEKDQAEDAALWRNEG